MDIEDLKRISDNINTNGKHFKAKMVKQMTAKRKVSLYDHRLKNVKESKINAGEYILHCSCGKTFNVKRTFYDHQRDWLNKQLEQYRIEVV